MFERIPPNIKKDNRAEEMVNRHLRNLFLGKKYYSMHSQSLASHPTVMEGEADFVIITDFGIFCLEVKGGTVRRNRGEWEYSGAKKGSRSPFDQASEATYPIIEALGKANQSKRNKFVIGWGVVFPDIVFDDKDPGWDEAHICDKRQFPHKFENYLVNLGEYWHQRLQETKKIRVHSKPDSADIQWAVRTIRPNIAHFSLIELEESKNELIILEDRLRVYLDQIVGSSSCRSVISGIAGTGKTVLIREAAERVPDDETILLLCFNATLARDLRHLFRYRANVTAIHFADLKRKIAESAEVSGRTLDDESLQYAVIEADAKERLKKYDWLLFDEAQDFVNTENWEAFKYLSKGGVEKEKFILAFDGKAQGLVYDNFDEPFFNHIKSSCDFPLQLERNYRNPNNIARKAALLIGEPEEKIEVARDFFALPKLVVTEPEHNDILLKVSKDIKQLISSGVEEGDITVLTFKKREESSLFGKKVLGGLGLKDLKRELSSDGSLFNGVTWSTVASFKGLENHYILLIEGENFNRRREWWRSQLYVALTRAKTDFRYYGKVDDECWKELTDAS